MTGTTLHETGRPVDFQLPPLNAILAYRGVYALCEIIERHPSYRLRATHYTTCLIGGPQPVWGLWTVHGKFVRFFGRKAAIADTYPKLVWRHKQATWSMVDVHDKDEAERRAELERLYKRGQEVTGREVDQVLADRPAENVVELRRTAG